MSCCTPPNRFYRFVDRLFPVTMLAMSLVIGFIVVVWAVQVALSLAAPEPEKKIPADEARFMVECVHEYELTPSQCRGILRGEDPPPPPDYLGC